MDYNEKQAKSLNVKDKKERSQKVKHLLSALNHINSALLLKPNSSKMQANSSNERGFRKNKMSLS